jgi:hypothetical protein
VTKKRLKVLPIVLFRRLRKMFLHNSFSHKRVQAISSLIEPFVDTTWGGRVAEKGLSQGLGDRYLPSETASRIRSKLASGVNQPFALRPNGNIWNHSERLI